MILACRLAVYLGNWSVRVVERQDETLEHCRTPCSSRYCEGKVPSWIWIPTRCFDWSSNSMHVRCRIHWIHDVQPSAKSSPTCDRGPVVKAFGI